ncbi:MAG: winged helix-turn-helix domain-containing protein [Kangiellaceae bacterium]|nr:winged helix-turn-helix domain-containing protein [Kangiellaceae bacterium]MCW9017333.1 winged helix-turn-helix domain-containing protein [Kangiellaceae bacterium]
MENAPKQESDTYKMPFRVGEFIVEPALNLLRKDEESIALVPKVMELLLCLAEASPDPVSQEVLFERVWPDQVVSDSSLYQAVAQLRKSFGDTGKQKRYIERISGKGYRLIKTVETIKRDYSVSQRNKHNQIAPSKYKAQRNWIIGVLLSIAIGLVYWRSNFPLLTNEAVSEKPSISAKKLLDIEQIDSLALINLELEQIVTGQIDIDQIDNKQSSTLLAFNDILLTQLGSIQNLKVVSVHKDNTKADVKAWLTGRVVSENNQVRVYLRLERADNREVVWAKIFTGNSDRLFELQDQITQDLLSLFNKKQASETFSQQSIAPQVFDQYLLARHLWEKRKADKLIQAKLILESLRDKQQLFPLAAVALCETYHFLFLYSDWELETVNKQCAPLLDLALEKSPGLGQALAAKGLLLSSLGQREKAREHFDRAVRFAPNYALGYLWYGNLLRDLGQYQKALSMSKKAYELSPMSPVVNRSLAYSHLNLRQVKEAKYFYDRALALETDYIHRAIGDLDFFPLTLERASAFITWAKNNPRVFQRQSVYRLNLAQVWLALGEISKAEQIVAEFETNGLNPQFTLYVKATLQIQRGEFESAAETFRKRLMLEIENERVFVPYVQALDWAGKPEQAYTQYVEWFPYLNNPSVEVDQNNLYQLMLFIVLKQKVKPQWNWQELAHRVDQKLAQSEYPQNLQVLEWLVFRGDFERAKASALEVMGRGWLPDTNAEPFAYYRMLNVFEKSELGESKFYELLRKNREYATGELE